MYDRKSKYPGRVVLTPVAGQTNTYDLERADEPEQEGTPLSKATLLKDETAALYGLGRDATNNDVLAKLSAAAFLDLTQLYTKVETASQLPVGATLSLNVDGVAKDFIVIQQGKPSNVYDDSCSGTWLMMKEVYVEMVVDTTDNDYQNSDVHAYLNNDFFGLLDSGIQSVVKTAKIPYWNGKGNGGSLATGANGLSAKVFLLSGIETGESGGSYMPSDGAAIGYFDSAEKRIAYNSNGEKKFWWTRSPYTAPNSSGTQQCWGITSNGGIQGTACNNDNYFVRPVFIVSDDTDVSGFGYYTDGEKVYTEQYSVGTIVDVFGGSVDLGGAKIETGSYTGTGTSGSGNKNSLTFSFIPKIVFIWKTASGYSSMVPSIYRWGNASLPNVCEHTVGKYTEATTGSSNTIGSISGNTASVSETTLTWYGYNSNYQLNSSGATYEYVAIG